VSSAPPLGRRERKKAATRDAIYRAAIDLFLARGFDAVTIREIADAADVSTKTVFAHFAQKEALAFGDESDRHARLVSAVRDRTAGVTVSDALRSHFLRELAAIGSGAEARVVELMRRTPALVEYAERMWLRHEDALLEAVTEELGLARPSDEVRFFVRFALDIQLTASRSSDPAAAVEFGFRVLDEGWRRHDPA